VQSSRRALQSAVCRQHWPPNDNYAYYYDYHYHYYYYCFFPFFFLFFSPPTRTKMPPQLPQEANLLGHFFFFFPLVRGGSIFYCHCSCCLSPGRPLMAAMELIIIVIITKQSASSSSSAVARADGPPEAIWENSTSGRRLSAAARAPLSGATPETLIISSRDY